MHELSLWLYCRCLLYPPCPQLVPGSPERHELPEHGGLQPPQLGHHPGRPRHRGQAVEVGVQVAGHQLLGAAGGEHVLAQPRVRGLHTPPRGQPEVELQMILREL